MRIEVGYSTAKIRVKFALMGSFIDDIRLVDGECVITPGGPKTFNRK